MFPGGIADKLGNRFEAKWAVQKLIEVFLGEAESLRFESIDPVDHGIEFILTRKTHKEWHQTKRQETGGNWTVRRLEKEGVLKTAIEKVSIGDEHIFVFVSEDPAKGLQALAEKAVIAQTADQFEAGLSEDQRKELVELKRVWGITTDQAQSNLKRCQFEVVSEATIDTYIRLLGGTVFNELAGAIFPVLRDYLESNFNREIHTEEARKELLESGKLTPRSPLDPTLRERLKHATQSYLKSYTPFGAGGRTIPRREAKEVANTLVGRDEPKVVLLTGSAGSGKSGIVREVIKSLEEDGISHLAFRVDRNLEVQSTRDLGNILIGRQEDPVVSLLSLGRHERSVLIIDQIDAVSEASGRVGSMRDVVFDLISTAQASKTVSVLAVCRSFDLTNDRRLRDLEQKERVCRIDVKLFDWENDVKPLFVSKDVDLEKITPVQRLLLTLPLNLSLFLEVIGTDSRTITFTSTSDLYNLLIERKQRAIRERGYAEFPLLEALSALTRVMSEDQILDAPSFVLDSFPNALDLLAGESLIIRTGNRVAFFHESFFDYAFARSFVADNRHILDFLKSDEQFLFRRTQVRQILTAYRQSGSKMRYLTELKSVLTSTDVRYHLKDCAARWLGMLDDPTDGELDILLSMDSPDEGMPILVRMALYSQANWFTLLQRRGLFTTWLTSENVARRNDALSILRHAVRKFPADVVQIVRAWWAGDGDRGQELLHWFEWFGEIPLASELLALNLDLIRSKPPGLFDKGSWFDRHSLSSWIKNDPDAASQVLRAWFETWFEVFSDDHPFKRDRQTDIDNHWLNELQQKSPTAFLDAAIPTFVETIHRIKLSQDGEPETDWTWYSPYEGESYGSDFFLSCLRSALINVAGKEPIKVIDYLRLVDPSSHPAALYLHLETIGANGAVLYQMLPPLLNNSKIFDAGPSGAQWLSLARAACATLPHMSIEEKTRIEDLIMGYWGELRLAKKVAHDLAAGHPEDEFWNRKTVICDLNRNGYEQWCILKTIGADRLSPKAVLRLTLLDRKFQGKSVAKPSSVEVGWVPPPIGSERAKFMTDAQWLQAMSSYHDDRETMRKNGRWVFHTGASGLAQVLKERTKEDPDRFAQLLFRLPKEVAHCYPEGILSGLAESQASRETLLRAIQYAHLEMGKKFGNGICRIIQNHPSLSEDDRAFEILLWYAENGDSGLDSTVEKLRDEKKIVNVNDLTEPGDRIVVRAYSGERGIAIEAVGTVLWEYPSRLDEGIKVIERLVKNEPLLTIRCCLVNPIYSVLRSDNKRAAGLLRQLVFRSDGIELTPLTTNQGLRALYYILHGCPNVGLELLDLLLKSDDETQRLIGTFHLFREAYYDAELVEHADALVLKDDTHRNIAASAAAKHLAYAEYRSRAEKQLVLFFDDPVKEIRSKAANCFRNLENEDLSLFRPLLSKFIQSKAFEEENFSFFLLLKESKQQTFEEVVLASERVIQLVEDNVKKGTSFREMHYLDDLILREYAAVAAQPEVRHRLLDVIDKMLFLGLYGTEKIVQEHERS